MPTWVLGRGWHEGAEARVELDFDASNVATVFRCVNETTIFAWFKITVTESGRSIERTFRPGTTEITLPTGVAARLTLNLDIPRQRILNIDKAFALFAGAGRPGRPSPVPTGRHP